MPEVISFMPSPEQLEPAPQPTITEHYGDEMVTIFDQEVAVRDLYAVAMEICPRKKLITVEAVDVMVAKALVKKGVVLEPIYERLLPPIPPKKETIAEKQPRDTVEKVKPLEVIRLKIETTQPRLEMYEAKIIKFPMERVLASMNEITHKSVDVPPKLVSVKEKTVEKSIKLVAKVAQRASAKPLILKKIVAPTKKLVPTVARLKSVEAEPLIARPKPIERPQIVIKTKTETVRAVKIELSPKIRSETKTKINPQVYKPAPVPTAAEIYKPVIQVGIAEASHQIEELDFVLPIVTLESEPLARDDIEITADNGLEIIQTIDTIENMELSEITEISDTTETYETIKTIQTVELTPEEIILQPVTEFIERVLPFMPNVSELILAELSVEAAVEVAAQVELIVTVADRLHVLIVKGETESGEVIQIEAFLSREYEQLLRTIGIVPTDELIQQFIVYIHSEAYDLRSSVTKKASLIEIEGTHESKIFDEDSVLYKAQLASAKLRQGFNTMIGRLAVNKLAA